jgi:hypothetical protein
MVKAAESRVAELLEVVKTSMESIARAQQRRALLTAAGYSHDRRVRVVVNADNVVIETGFDDVDELTVDELADAVTAAAQRAAAEIARMTAELKTSMLAEQSALPAFSEVVEQLPDVLNLLPEPPEVSTDPPDSAGRAAAGARVAGPDHPEAEPGRGATETSW